MMESESEPTILKLNGPLDALPLVSSFSDLSAGTEFDHYKDPQWRFLLSGEEITAFILHNENEGEKTDGIIAHAKFDCCVLKVEIGDNDVGFGMVLTRKSKRRRGLSRTLLEKAMKGANEQGKRHVLAVCSAMAVPLYRQLGFKIAGMISFLTCSVSDILQSPRKHFESEFLVVNNGKKCVKDQFILLVNLDEDATGRKRTDRMRLLLDGHAQDSYSTVALLGTEGCVLDRLTTAVAYQDCADGPLFVGPMKGKEECVIPLLHALIEKHFEDREVAEVNDIRVNMMITDHPNLVKRFLEIKGISMLWESPSMTSDGNSVYHNGDGSYLAMMHPTLG